MTTEIRTEHPHVVRVVGAGGDKAVIAGTNISVWFIIGQSRAGDSPDDIVAAYPHLTLAGVHDAISYYYDHRAEIDAILTEQTRLAHASDVSQSS